MSSALLAPLFHLRASAAALALGSVLLAGCAEGGGGGGDLSPVDGGFAGWDGSSADAGNWYAGYEGGAVPPNVIEVTVDGGSAGFLPGFIAGLGAGDAGPGGSESTGQEVWTLNSDSHADCPEEPPPIPIIGGLCAGIYFGCGWTSESGKQYSCVCDWVHWLCI